MTDAVATPFHALRRADMEAGTTCAVFGLGGLGMHAIRLARALGAGWIVGVDLDERNLERALAWGADEVVSAADGKPARAIRKRSDGGVDRAFEFVGNPDSQSQAVKSLRPGGRAVVVGLTPRELSTLPAALFVAQELEVVGAFGSSRSDVEDLFGMVADGRLDLSKSITHRWSLPELPDALRALEMREGHPIRMIVSYG